MYILYVYILYIITSAIDFAFYPPTSHDLKSFLSVNVVKQICITNKSINRSFSFGDLGMSELNSLMSRLMNFDYRFVLYIVSYYLYVKLYEFLNYIIPISK